MKLFFVTALRNIHIVENLGRGDKINDTTFITNQIGAIANNVTQEFERGAGSLEAAYIREAQAVVYAHDERPETTSTMEYLLEKLLIVTTFLNALWLIKDNAVNNELGFTSYIRNSIPYIDSNSHSVSYSMADGRSSPIEFTQNELRHARSLYREKFGPSRFIEAGSAAAATESPRLVRALYFIQAARANKDLGLKVAHYCSALEALFASGHSELIHKLSERVAAFLEETHQARSQLYASVKDAYAIRSIVVHGAATKSRKKDFRVSSERLDEILRRILLTFLTTQSRLVIFELGTDEFERVFLSRIFGATWHDIEDDLKLNLQGGGKKGGE